VGQQSKPAYFAIGPNFVYCQPIYVIFGTCTLWAICNRKIYN